MFLPILMLLWSVQDAAPAAETCPSLPVGTLLKIVVVDSVLSRTAHNDDWFRVQLAEPLVIDGKTVIPAGTPGKGQVIQASHPKFFNNTSGELIVAARYLELDGKRLPLRHAQILATTRSIPDRNPLSYTTNVDVPAGALVTAKVAGECVTPAPSPSTAAK